MSSMIKNFIKCQKGTYSIVMVLVVSAIFMIISLNLNKKIQDDTKFETINKEKILRHRVVTTIKNHLHDTKSCENSFNSGNSMTTSAVKDKNNQIIFDLSQGKYKYREFTEKALPKAKELKILHCNPDNLKNGKEFDPSICNNIPLNPVESPQGVFHSESTLRIKFEKYFFDEDNPNDPGNFYFYYIPIYVQTTNQTPSLNSSSFETCSTFTPIIKKFSCPSMTFEFSCCRYIYEINLSKLRAGDPSYTNTWEPRERSDFIPNSEDPQGRNLQEDCDGSAVNAFIKADCAFAQGWNIYTECRK